MVNKKDEKDEKKVKRLSKSERLHVRRMKQAARKGPTIVKIRK
jgi:hypothetical protein